MLRRKSLDGNVSKLLRNKSDPSSAKDYKAVIQQKTLFFSSMTLEKKYYQEVPTLVSPPYFLKHSSSTNCDVSDLTSNDSFARLSSFNSNDKFEPLIECFNNRFVLPAQTQNLLKKEKLYRSISHTSGIVPPYNTPEFEARILSEPARAVKTIKTNFRKNIAFADHQALFSANILPVSKLSNASSKASSASNTPNYAKDDIAINLRSPQDNQDDAFILDNVTLLNAITPTIDTNAVPNVNELKIPKQELMNSYNKNSAVASFLSYLALPKDAEGMPSIPKESLRADTLKVKYRNRFVKAQSEFLLKNMHVPRSHSHTYGTIAPENTPQLTTKNLSNGKALVTDKPEFKASLSIDDSNVFNRKIKINVNLVKSLILIKQNFISFADIVSSLQSSPNLFVVLDSNPNQARDRTLIEYIGEQDLIVQALKALNIPAKDIKTQVDVVILVVEDNYIATRVIKRLLEGLGLQAKNILTATDGLAGLKMVESNRFKEAKQKMIISDIDMQPMNGIEMAKRLLITYPGIKILFQSSNYTSYRHELDKFNSANIFGVTKPLLKEAIQTFMYQQDLDYTLRYKTKRLNS